MRDLSLPPTLSSDSRDAESRLQSVERNRTFIPSAIPAVPLGAVHGTSFIGLDATSYVNVMRADVYCTAPTLDYDLFATTDYGTSITSVEWQLSLTRYDDLSTTVLADGSTTDTTQFAGFVDLFDLIGEDIFLKFVRFDISVKRTGGSGDATVRLNKPLLLRIR